MTDETTEPTNDIPDEPLSGSRLEFVFLPDGNISMTAEGPIGAPQYWTAARLCELEGDTSYMSAKMENARKKPGLILADHLPPQRGRVS